MYDDDGDDDDADDDADDDDDDDVNRPLPPFFSFCSTFFTSFVTVFLQRCVAANLPRVYVSNM